MQSQNRGSPHPPLLVRQSRRLGRPATPLIPAAPPRPARALAPALPHVEPAVGARFAALPALGAPAIGPGPKARSGPDARRERPHALSAAHNPSTYQHRPMRGTYPAPNSLETARHPAE